MVMRWYSGLNAAFVALPHWSENALLVIGCVMIGLSIYGVLINRCKLRKGYQYYWKILVIISICMILCAISLLKISNDVFNNKEYKEVIQREIQPS